MLSEMGSGCKRPWPRGAGGRTQTQVSDHSPHLAALAGVTGREELGLVSLPRSPCSEQPSAQSPLKLVPEGTVSLDF